MNIQNISKENKEAVVKLSTDDLTIICNALYAQLPENQKNERFLQLYSDMMIARDLCQYGHIDNFCLQNVVKCRNGIGKGLDGMLPDEDVKIFDAYLDQNVIRSSFENSDWLSVCKKIIGATAVNEKARSSEESDR